MFLASEDAVLELISTEFWVLVKVHVSVNVVYVHSLVNTHTCEVWWLFHLPRHRMLHSNAHVCKLHRVKLKSKMSYDFTVNSQPKLKLYFQAPRNLFWTGCKHLIVPSVSLASKTILLNSPVWIPFLCPFLLYWRGVGGSSFAGGKMPSILLENAFNVRQVCYNKICKEKSREEGRTRWGWL